jgi:hypothetical protein
MQINLITKATVKEQLGLTDATYDTEITSNIPIVSSDVRRILNEDYEKYVLAVFSSSAATIDFGVVRQQRQNIYESKAISYSLGQVVYHPNIPEDTYLKSFDPSTGLYTLSNTPTDSGDYVYPTILISQWPTISKMIWYRISTVGTTDASGDSLKSLSYGPVSKTFSDAEINKQWNYPQKLIDDLGTPFVKVG